MKAIVQHKEKALPRILTSIFAALLIILFINTSGSKIFDRNVFILQMGKQPLPPWSKPILVWALPFLELGVVALLLLAKTRRIGFHVAAVLMFSYTVYTGLAYSGAFGFIPCACGKIFNRMSWNQHFLVNIALTCTALAGIYFSGRLRTPDMN